MLHSSNKPGELSQWFCHDDSTINIGICIIIIIIIIIAWQKSRFFRRKQVALRIWRQFSVASFWRSREISSFSRFCRITDRHTDSAVFVFMILINTDSSSTISKGKRQAPSEPRWPTRRRWSEFRPQPDTILRPVYSDTTQLNWTQLNSTSNCRRVHSVNNCHVSMNVVTQL